MWVTHGNHVSHYQGMIEGMINSVEEIKENGKERRGKERKGKERK